MTYITGDLHGVLDLHKLDKLIPVATENDYIIICGDMGICWNGISEYMVNYYFHRYHQATVLFVDGNHEDHDLLDSLPTKQMFGDEVGVVADKIYHLKRGRIYTIDGKTIFTFGGAMSIDRQDRVEGESWWARELPSASEYQLGWDNLEKVDYKVDCIITHDCPSTISQEIYKLVPEYAKFDPYKLTLFFDEVAKKVQFEHWFFGHHHIDEHYGEHEQFHAMYNDIALVC